MNDRSVNFDLHREVQDDGSESVVSVNLSHSEKKYCVSVYRTRLSLYGGVKWRSVNLMDGIFLSIEDAPRFSQKRLATLAETILDDARVRAAVEQARTRKLP
jgi:hypothetical protein